MRSYRPCFTIHKGNGCVAEWTQRQPLPQRENVAAVSMAPPARRLILRGVEATAAAGEAFGVVFPLEPCRAAQSGARSALWLGPDEWLLMFEPAVRGEIASAIEAALAGRSHALVDISDRNLGLRVEGARAEDVLAAGCPLDLDPGSFPVGMCTRTLLGKAEIVLWRTAQHAFHLEVVRSFLPYVVGLLEAGVSDAAALAAQ